MNKMRFGSSMSTLIYLCVHILRTIELPLGQTESQRRGPSIVRELARDLHTSITRTLSYFTRKRSLLVQV